MDTDLQAGGPSTEGAGTRFAGSDRVVEGILARLASPGGIEAFRTQVRSVRGCRRPIRLSGYTATTGADGRRRERFDSRTLPDGVLLTACGTRRETLCPPCASLYRGDAFALVAAGLRGGKGVPETVADHPAVLLTLTAPSFGPVHRRRTDARCHPPGSPHPSGVRCPHGRPLVCRSRHAPDDERIGQALCADCYDHEGAVLFNAGVSELWRRTTIYALRAVGSLLGMSARTAARTLRLSYAKVVEFQRRGSVHLHALVRVDRRGEETGRPAERIDAATLATALRLAARKVSAPMPGEVEGRRMLWGEQLDATVVTEAEGGRRRAAAYLAKYATKGSDAVGLLDHRLRAPLGAGSGLPDHLRALVATAWRLGDRSDLSALRLRAWAHTCGYRGHFLTKSRHYSTTFGSLRAERQRWRIAQRQGAHDEEPPGPDVLELREWTYEGTGYRSAGDACLARSIEEELALGRFVARDADPFDADGREARG